MLTILPPFFAALLAFSSVFVEAVPQNRNRKGKGGGSTQSQTLAAQAAAVPQGISEATDGSTILDTNATIKYGYSFSGCQAVG